MIKYWWFYYFQKNTKITNRSAVCISMLISTRGYSRNWGQCPEDKKGHFLTIKVFEKALIFITYTETIIDWNWTWTQNHLVHENNTQPFSQTGQNDWAVFWVLICTVHLTVCSCHVTYAFQSESTLYSSWKSRNSLLEAGTKSEV